MARVSIRSWNRSRLDGDVKGSLMESYSSPVKRGDSAHLHRSRQGVFCLCLSIEEKIDGSELFSFCHAAKFINVICVPV